MGQPGMRALAEYVIGRLDVAAEVKEVRRPLPLRRRRLIRQQAHQLLSLAIVNQFPEVYSKIGPRREGRWS